MNEPYGLSSIYLKTTHQQMTNITALVGRYITTGLHRQTRHDCMNTKKQGPGNHPWNEGENKEDLEKESIL